MDARGLLLLIASFLLCFHLDWVHAASSATFALSTVILKDVAQDGPNHLLIQIKTTLTSTDANGPISLNSFKAGEDINNVYTSQSTRITPCPSSSTSCVEIWEVAFKIVDTASGCEFNGANFEWVGQDSDGTGSTNYIPPNPITLVPRDLCDDSQYTLDADVSLIAPGPFADPAFSTTKDYYFVNDVIYFPYQIRYADLTIAKLTFNTISVSDGTNIVQIYETTGSASGNLAAGNAVGLQVHPTTSSVGPGATGSAWFSMQLNRESGSPFENADTTTTTYTVTTTFDIEYKNAKRATENEAKVFQAQSTFVFSNHKASASHQRRSIQDQSIQEQLASEGGFVSVSALLLLVAALIGMML